MIGRRIAALGAAFVALELAMLPAACASAQARTGGTSVSPARASIDTTRLRRTLDSLATAYHGTVGYAVFDFDTGVRLSRRRDETLPTASLIKVPILVTVYDLVRQKKLSLDDRLTVLAIDKVLGSGQPAPTPKPTP